MKYDSYSRFLKSDLFLKHKRTEEEEEDPSDAQTAAKRASRIYNTWAPASWQDWQLSEVRELPLRTMQGLYNRFAICKDWNVWSSSTGYVYFINCLTSKFCMMANLT